MKIVEAAVLVPIILMVFLCGSCLAIDLYEEIQNQHEEMLVENMWEVKNFYIYEGVRQLTND